MYAVIESGGKQYRVELGSEIQVDRLDVQPGDTITLELILLVADGDATAVGQPTVDGASVSARVLGQDLGSKVIVFKYKPKARTRVKKGFRSRLTTLRISDIAFDGRSAAKDAEDSEAKKAKAEEATAREAEKAAADKAAADKELAAQLAAATEKATAGKAATGKGTTGTASAADETAESKPKRTAKKSTTKASAADKGLSATPAEPQAAPDAEPAAEPDVVPGDTKKDG